MISLELLPAAHGDVSGSRTDQEKKCTASSSTAVRPHTYETGLRERILKLPEDNREFELMVVTHIDADHIDGSLILLQELAPLHIRIKELWFNGWDQLPETKGAPAVYAPLQGEYLGGLITVNQSLKDSWNQHFDNKAVAVPDNLPLPEKLLEGGAKLTMLGPTEAELKRLRARLGCGNPRLFTRGQGRSAAPAERTARLTGLQLHQQFLQFGNTVTTGPPPMVPASPSSLNMKALRFSCPAMRTPPPWRPR